MIVNFKLTVVGAGMGTCVGAGMGTCVGAGMGTCVGAGMGTLVGAGMGTAVGAARRRRRCSAANAASSLAVSSMKSWSFERSWRRR